MKQWKKWAALLAVVVLLVVAYLAGGEAPSSDPMPQNTIAAEQTEEPKQEEKTEESQEAEATEEAKKQTVSEQKDMAEETKPANSQTEEAPLTSELPSGETGEVQTANQTQEPQQDAYFTDPVPEGKPEPVDEAPNIDSPQSFTCTLSVSCATILDHMDWLDEEKAELVPEDGILFGPTEVTFYEGESVFHVLQREMKQAKIPMEFEDTPMYNSAYIEGIGNLYEFDCGQMSGWMYRVNGWFPNYGCSRYQLQDGDVVEWVYTCELGDDVGGSNRLE